VWLLWALMVKYKTKRRLPQQQIFPYLKISGSPEREKNFRRVIDSFEARFVDTFRPPLLRLWNRRSCGPGQPELSISLIISCPNTGWSESVDPGCGWRLPEICPSKIRFAPSSFMLLLLYPRQGGTSAGKSALALSLPGFAVSKSA